MKYLAVLGTNPELASLEFSTIYPDAQWNQGYISSTSQIPDISQLGGTIKIGQVVAQLPRSFDGLDKTILQLLQNIQGEKIHFGFSVYAGDAATTTAQVNSFAKQCFKHGLVIKKQLRSTGASVRLVTEQAAALSSVTVDKEKLLHHHTDFIIAVYKKYIVLAQTLAIQDYQQFSQRDYGRPERDHHSGMLPPKVARMMLNISAPETNSVILDPFCGSGTVLQEALLAGYQHVLGSDISEYAIDDTAANLAWLQLQAQQLIVSDVKDITQHVSKHSIDRIVGEGYLGPVRPKKTEKIHRQLSQLYRDMLNILPHILKPSARIVFALPAWKRHEDILTIDLQNSVAHNNFTEFHTPIMYGRKHATVMRHIHFWEYTQ